MSDRDIGLVVKMTVQSRWWLVSVTLDLAGFLGIAEVPGRTGPTMSLHSAGQDLPRSRSFRYPASTAPRSTDVRHGESVKKIEIQEGGLDVAVQAPHRAEEPHNLFERSQSLQHVLQIVA